MVTWAPFEGGSSASAETDAVLCQFDLKAGTSPQEIGAGREPGMRCSGDNSCPCRYAAAMATQKVSVTLESAALGRARSAAGPRGLSSYVDSALAEKLDRDERRIALLAYLDALEAADPTPELVQRRAMRRSEKIRAAAHG
jgi:hypothetical protein